MKWYGGWALAELKKDARKKVLEACIVTKKYVKESMKAGGRTESGFAVKGKDPETGAKAGRINSYRSKPGEVPRVQTGTLRRSYTHELHPTLPLGRMGTNIFYGKLLEFGTMRVAARPHVRPALAALRAVYIKIFGAKIGGRTLGE